MTHALLNNAIMPAKHHTIAIASGKGGVGKTWFSITLAECLAKLGQKLLIFDGDFGLANIDIQLGLMPHTDLATYFTKNMPLKDIITPYTKGHFDVLAGNSGSGSLGNLSVEQLLALKKNLTKLAGSYDYLIKDLGAGLDRTVRHLAHGSDLIIIVTTNEPTALTDAYATIKILHQDNPHIPIEVVINRAKNQSDGLKTFDVIRNSCETFLKFSPALFGVIHEDPKVSESIKHQQSLMSSYPYSSASMDVQKIAQFLIERNAL